MGRFARSAISLRDLNAGYVVAQYLYGREGGQNIREASLWYDDIGGAVVGG